MFSSSDRPTPLIQRALVLFQVLLLLAMVFTPLSAAAADPAASPDPSASAPAATADPTPDVTPAPDPTPSPTPEPAAATPDPTPDPSAAPSSDPSVEPPPATPDPTPAPPAATPDPTPAPTEAPSSAPVGNPTIASDKADYAPGELVTLTGTGWQPGESVHIFVNDDWGSSWSRNVDVVADSSGAITDQFNLPNWFVATYSVRATGTLSGTAVTSFTDGTVRVRARLGSTNLAANFAVNSFRVFTPATNITCATPSSASFPSTAFTTPSGTGNGYAPDVPGMSVSTGSFDVTAPATATDGTTTYSFTGWTSDATLNATLVSTTGTTGCFRALSSGQISLTANYSATVATSTTSSNASATYGASSVTLTATVTPASGPAVSSGTVTFTVKKGAATVGSPVTSATVSGGDASASFPLTGVGADTYTIQAIYNPGTGFTGSNNAGQSPAPTLTVGRATLTVTPDAKSRTYGQAAPTYTFSVTGFQNGQTKLTAAGYVDPTCSSDYSPTTAVADSPRTISCTGGAADNYTFDTTATALLTVGPALLTITAVDRNKLLGESVTFDTTTPSNDFTVGGLVNSDAVTSITLTSAGAPASATVSGSPYAIVPSAAAGTGLANYIISYVNGRLFVLYSTGACLGSPGHQVLQPINVDGSSVFKKGSTVPVKFRVCDVNGNSIGSPGVVTSFQLTGKFLGLDPQFDLEAIVSTTPDTAFRWSSTDQQWIFNLNTKNLSANYTYRYTITLNDGSTIIFEFGLK